MQGRRWQQGGTPLKLVGALPIAGKGNPDIAFVNIKLLLVGLGSEPAYLDHKIPTGLSSPLRMEGRGKKALL